MSKGRAGRPRKLSNWTLLNALADGRESGKTVRQIARELHVSVDTVYASAKHFEIDIASTSGCCALPHTPWKWPTLPQANATSSRYPRGDDSPAANLQPCRHVLRPQTQALGTVTLSGTSAIGTLAS